MQLCGFSYIFMWTLNYLGLSKGFLWLCKSTYVKYGETKSLGLTGQERMLFFSQGVNKGDVSVCFELLWKGPLVWLCLLLSRKPTFPGVLFMLIVLFLLLSSSRFWLQIQSNKCGQTHMLGLPSLCPSVSVLLLCPSSVFPCLCASCFGRISLVQNLFRDSSLMVMKQLFGKTA